MSIQCCLKKRERINAFPGVPSFPRNFSSCFRSQYLLKAVSKGATTRQPCGCSSYGTGSQNSAEKCQLTELETLPSKGIYQMIGKYESWLFHHEFFQLFGSLKATAPTGTDHLPFGLYLDIMDDKKRVKECNGQRDSQKTTEGQVFGPNTLLHYCSYHSYFLWTFLQDGHRQELLRPVHFKPGWMWISGTDSSYSKRYLHLVRK